MDTFSNLEIKLQAFERSQTGAINSCPGCRSLTPAANNTQGSIQCVAIDDSTHSEKAALPVVVAVGINFHQNPTISPHSPFANYLGLSATGKPVVQDDLSEMRSAFTFSLAAFSRNSAEWLRQGRAAIGKAPSPPIHLIAMNLSPFITRLPWSKLTSTEQAEILAVWPWHTHLNLFRSALGPLVPDLWIGHGINHAVPLFDRWKLSCGITDWITTYNLSRLGELNMKNARRKGDPFYL